MTDNRGAVPFSGETEGDPGQLERRRIAGCELLYRSVREQGIPTLLTWGNLDRSLSGDSMRRLRDLLPEIEYHQFEETGHLAHYEFPDRINPPLIRFLTG